MVWEGRHREVPPYPDQCKFGNMTPFEVVRQEHCVLASAAQPNVERLLVGEKPVARVEDGDDALSRPPLRPVHRGRVGVGEVAKLRVVMRERDVPAPCNAEREGRLADGARPTFSVRPIRRSTSRNRNAPPLKEIEPPEKFPHTRRRRHHENDNAPWFHFVTVWFLAIFSVTIGIKTVYGARGSLFHWILGCHFKWTRGRCRSFPSAPP